MIENKYFHCSVFYEVQTVLDIEYHEPMLSY